MRIYLYITPFFPSPNDWSGAYGLDFVKALKQRLELKVGVEKWKVLVFKPGDGSDYEIDGVVVHTFREWKLPSGIFPFLFRRHNERAFIAKVHSILTANHQPLTAIFVCHANTAEFAIYPLALKLLNPECKTLLHHHDLQSFGLNSGLLRHFLLYNLYMFPVLRRMHEQMDCHIFISEASRRSFLAAPNTDWTDYTDYKKQMRGLPFSPVRIKHSIVLHNGVDATIFYPQPATPDHQLSSSTSTLLHGKNNFTIGCIGNFQELKGQLTLLEAFRLLRESGYTQLRLKLLGGDSTLGRLQRLKGARSYQSRCKQFACDNHMEDCVEFLSEVSHEELPDFYRSLDLFVLPSCFEGFGCVYTEAYACGVPFIACEGQGIEDVICEADRHLWLAKKHDVKDLTEKIKNYIKNGGPQVLYGAVDLQSSVAWFVREVVK